MPARELQSSSLGFSPISQRDHLHNRLLALLVHSPLVLGSLECQLTLPHFGLFQKKHSPTLRIQHVVRWTSRRSVENPGISYSDLLILIPGSRVICTWSLLCYSSYEGLDSYLWHHYDIISLDAYLLSMASFWHHMIPLLGYTILANALYPSYWLSGLCISLYLTAYTCTNSTGQYIRLALQPVSITKVLINYHLLIPSSLSSETHFHSISLLLFVVNQDYQLPSKSPLGSYSLPVPAQTRSLWSRYAWCRAWCPPMLGSSPYLYVWHLSLTYNSYSKFLYHMDWYRSTPVYHRPLPVMTGPSTSSLHIPHYHFYYHPLLFWTHISPLLLSWAPVFIWSLFLVHPSANWPCRPYQQPVPCGNLYGSALYHFFYSLTSPS